MILHILNAMKIAVLVVLGVAFIIHTPQISRIVKGEYKVMNKKKVTGKIIKWIGGFGGVLGLAFYFGAFQAYVQGFFMQIAALGVVGTFCLIVGLLCFVFGIRKEKVEK